MKTKDIFMRTVLTAMMMLTALCVHAVINGGTITLKVGESYHVDASIGGGLTQTGSWSRSGSVFTITSRSDKTCTIQGNYLGTGTLYYTGYAGAYSVDYYWTVNVVSSSTPDPAPGSDYKDGSRFYYTSNGVSVQYKVISAANKTCMVGAGSAEDRDLAVPKSTNISSLTIPSMANGFKVVEVAKCAFCGCKDIKKITLPETITRIGSNAFQSCASFTSFTIPNSVTEIIEGAFSVCDNLEEVIIGKSVKEIGYDAFGDDKKLKSITVLATEPPLLNSSAFVHAEEVYKNATLYVPEGCVAAYKAANTWKQFSRIEKIGGGSDEPEGIAIDATNFPDANFRNYLLGLSLGKDGVLTEAEIKNVLQFYVEDKNISSLKGIEHFTALTKLYCRNNQLTTLDMSKNTALTSLQCDNNQLTTLDVSGCAALTFLDCHSNQLTTLDVSGCTALTYLICSGNQLTALDVSKSTTLTSLQCNNNQLTTLNASGCVALNSLSCKENPLTILNISRCTALTKLDFYIYDGDGQLTALDVSGCTALTKLRCDNNQLTTLDVSGCTALTELNCCFNQLATLDISECTALTQLLCYSNQLTTLNLSKNTALTKLYCQSNQLTALDFSKNTTITDIYCYRNQIRGSSMDDLIKSLPQNSTNEKHTLCMYRNTDGIEEGNVCTKAQAAAIKAKEWTPLYYNGTEFLEYEGSEEEFGTGVKIDETHFPDANFRNYLLSQSYGKDGILTEEEIETITTMNVHNLNISSLQGIEYFTDLTTLYCHNNKLTSLDVSKNTLLRRLDCFGNRIQGAAMDNLISSLPMNTTNDIHIFGVWEMSYSGNEDENVCTKAQVEVVKTKGWTSYYADGYTALLEPYYGCDADPVSIKLSELETIGVNNTIQLTATIQPAYITPELTWSSSAENVAMVTSTGKVLGVSAGAAIITVRTSNGLSAECFVIVQDTSDIEDVKAGSNADAAIYTLSGQKVTDTTKKGVYIINGKKVVVK